MTTSRPIRALFVVQGEGRGHMTQALALRRMLAEAGHEVTGVLVGRSDRREVPAFFLRKIDAPVEFFPSPNLVVDGRDRSIRVLASIARSLLDARAYLGGVRRIHRAVEEQRPDVVVNFFDPLVGLYALRYRSRVPVVCVGHQCLLHHPAFRYPPGRAFERWCLRTLARVTTLGAARRLALSFYPAEPLADGRTAVVPPLLRPEVFEQPAGREEPYLLVYLLNSGYADEVIRWHEAHPEVRLHCFWDRPGAEEVVRHGDRLAFHRLDDEKFLRLMARSSGLVTTAGFESVCEAMYFGKPVYMLPVEGHYEQSCNAHDAARAGAGLAGGRFDLAPFLAYLPAHRADPAEFRAWVAEAPARIVGEIEAAAVARFSRAGAVRALPLPG